MARYLSILILYLLALSPLTAQDEKMCPHPDTAKALMAYDRSRLLLKANPPKVDSAIYYMDKAKDIFQSFDCWEQVVRMSYNLVVLHNKRKDDKKYQAELRFAQKIAQAHLADTSRWKGKVLLLMGEHYMHKRSFDSSEMYIVHAQMAFRSTNSWKEYVNACRTMAQVYYYKQDFLKMERYVDEAFKITKDKLKSDPSLVRSILQLYGALYYRTGDYENALKRTEEGLAIVLKDMKNNEDSTLVASYYNNIGLFYLDIGDVVKAEDYCNNALNLSLRLEDKFKAATIYLNLAEFFFNKTQYNKAYSYFQKGYTIIQTVQQREVPQSSIDRTFIQINMGLARSAYEIGKTEEAFKVLSRNLEIHRQEPYKEEVTHHVFGTFYLKEKKYKEAKESLNKALSIALRLYVGGRHPDIADLYVSFSELSESQNEMNEAQAYLEKALLSISMTPRDRLNFDDLSQISDKDLLVKILEKQAGLSLKQGKLQDAADRIFLAAKLTDELKNAFKSEGSKLHFLQKILPVYERALEVVYTIQQKSSDKALLEKAFQLVEKSKSALLLDALRSEEARAFGDVPDAMLKEERRIARELAKSQKALYEAQALSKISDVEKLQKELLELKLQEQRLQDTLERKYNNYYTLKYKDQIATIAQVQDFLKSGTTLLEFFVGNNKVYLFSINRKSAQLHAFTKDASFDKSIKTLRVALTSNMSLNDSEKVKILYAHIAEQGFTLYDKFIKNALDASTERIVIIADGLLNYIPFDVLLTEKVDPKGNADFRKLPYLMLKYAIHYHYSASLMLFDIKKSRGNGKILGMAPTYRFDRNTKMSDDRQRKIRSSVEELPGAKKEVTELSQIYRGTFLYDDEANEANFKKLAENENFGVIHLAMHGWVDENRPPYSSLVLSYTEDKTEDNLLHAYELNLLKLKADLVVLSACETGFGKYERGEGVVSIGRGFMYAGVPSLVMTLWPINDRATALLVTEFYNQLSKGKSKSEAMRAAKRHYLETADETTAHPFFWASFITVGDDAPIRIKKRSDWMNWALWIGVSVVFVAAVGYWAGRVRKTIRLKHSEDKHLHH